MRQSTTRCWTSSAIARTLIGFGDLSAEEIELLSGLPLEQAALAKEREFTEPFMIDDESRIPEMDRIALSDGFKITSGGRFFHLTGAQQDKGRAVRLCASVFSQNTGDGLLTIGLGDSANDLSMLKRVDIPILIPHPDGSFEDIELLNLKKAPHPGSRGWNHAVLEVLDRLEGWSTSGRGRAAVDRTASQGKNDGRRLSRVRERGPNG